MCVYCIFFFFQAEDGIRDLTVTGVQTCALPISVRQPHFLVPVEGRVVRGRSIRSDRPGSGIRGQDGGEQVERPVEEQIVHQPAVAARGPSRYRREGEVERLARREGVTLHVVDLRAGSIRVPSEQLRL